MKYFLLILAVLALSCSETIDVPDTPVEVTSIGPIELAASNVVVNYTLKDFEGDDAEITVEICDGASCGVAFEGSGSDGTLRVPTVPRDTDVPHVFTWDIGCGLWLNDERVGVDIAAEYTVVITPFGGEPFESEVFVLEELGATSVMLECERV